LSNNKECGQIQGVPLVKRIHVNLSMAGFPNIRVSWTAVLQDSSTPNGTNNRNYAAALSI
jgi:hypothetical protein